MSTSWRCGGQRGGSAGGLPGVPPAAGPRL